LNEPARITTKLQALEVAKLAWLPQETIVFNWARLSRQTEIEISSGAELLALEWLVLGRAAHGEEMSGGHITDSWRVKKDDRLIWADSFRITDDIFAHLHRKALLANCKAVATLIYFGPCPDARLEFVRHVALSMQPVRGDIGFRAHYRSLCGDDVIRPQARLERLSPAIEP
jgi:urease accessory protein